MQGNPLDDVRVGQLLVKQQIEAGILISLDEAAERLKVSKQAIRNFIDGRRLFATFYGRKKFVEAAGVELLRYRDTKRGPKPRR